MLNGGIYGAPKLQKMSIRNKEIDIDDKWKIWSSNGKRSCKTNIMPNMGPIPLQFNTSHQRRFKRGYCWNESYDIKRGIDKAVESVIDKLKTFKKVKVNDKVPRLNYFCKWENQLRYDLCYAKSWKRRCNHC